MSEKTLRRAFLSVGSNLGERHKYLQLAVESLPGVINVSNVYETAPVGGPDQQDFLNIVVEIETDLSPNELLGVCHRIESLGERTRSIHWGPRTLDIDIIWIDGVEMDTESLTIPHPRWQERRFVLVPLQELAPELVDADTLRLSNGTVALIGPLDSFEELSNER